MATTGQPHPCYIDLHIVNPGPCPQGTHQLGGAGRCHGAVHSSNGHCVISSCGPEGGSSDGQSSPRVIYKIKHMHFIQSLPLHWFSMFCRDLIHKKNSTILQTFQLSVIFFILKETDVIKLSHSQIYIHVFAVKLHK